MNKCGKFLIRLKCLRGNSVRPTLQLGLSRVKGTMYSHLLPEQQTEMKNSLNDAVRRSNFMDTVYHRRANNVS